MKQSPRKSWSFCSTWRSDGRKPRRRLWPSVTTVGNFCAGHTMAGPVTTGDGGKFWQLWKGRFTARMACCFGKTSVDFHVGKLSTGKASILLIITHVGHYPLLPSQVVFVLLDIFMKKVDLSCKIVKQILNYFKFHRC